MRFHELLETANAEFRLHPALDPQNYSMTNSLRDVRKWKALTYVANSGGQVGDMGEVGYVMVSLTDNSIIPISREDEHNMGKDLLYDFMEGTYTKPKKPLPIDPESFYPVWPMANYVRDEKQAKALLPALKKYLAYGGNDGTVVGTQQMRGRMMHFSDFIATEGKVELVTGKLAPIGQRVYDHLDELSKMIAAAQDTDDRIKLQPIFRKAIELCRYLASDYCFLKLDVMKMAEQAPKEIRVLQKANDLQGLRELIFGFDGIKNTMHRRMKKAMENEWFAEDMQAIWGDTDLAIAMLGNL